MIRPFAEYERTGVRSPARIFPFRYHHHRPALRTNHADVEPASPLRGERNPFPIRRPGRLRRVPHSGGFQMPPRSATRGNDEQIGWPALARNKTNRARIRRPAGRRFGVAVVAQLPHITPIGSAYIKIRTSSFVPDKGNVM